MFIWAALKENARLAMILWIISKKSVRIKDFCWCNDKIPETKATGKPDAENDIFRGPVTWKVTWKDIANWRIQRLDRLYEVATPCMDLTTNVKEEEIGSLGELSTVCSQIVVKCLYLARIGSPDVLWSVKQTCPCGHRIDKKLVTKRLARLVSYIHHTCEYRQCCYVGNTAQKMPIRIVSRL